MRVADWSGAELMQVLDVADELKGLQRHGDEHRLLPGRTLGMIFQKPSTRTRVSFEVGIYQLGGMGLYLSAGDLQLGRGETVKDTASTAAERVSNLMPGGGGGGQTGGGGESGGGEGGGTPAM